MVLKTRSSELVLQVAPSLSFTGNLKAKQSLNYTHTHQKIKGFQKALVQYVICKSLLFDTPIIIHPVSFLSFLQHCKTSEPSLHVGAELEVFSLSLKIS